MSILHKFIFALLLMGLWLALGCGKEELPVTRLDEPDFWVAGTLAGESLRLEAGENGYVMGTDYAVVPPDLWAYRGHLSPRGCADCPRSLSLYVRDYRLRPGEAATDIDSALRLDRYAYYRIDDPPGKQVSRVAFSIDQTNAAATYQWDFGDGNTYTGADPIHDYTDPEAQTYQVCLETQDASGCATSICNEVFLEDSVCQLDFEHILTPGSSYISFQAQVEGTPPYSYRWDFGDGFGSSLANPGYYYAQPGLYTVCLTVTDAQGCQQQLCKNIAADPAFCENNFSYDVRFTSIPDTAQFSRVTLVWIDEAGTRYSSALGPQGSESFFDLLAQAPYQPNQAGQAVRRVKARFRATLYAEDGRTLELRADEAWLGIAHP